MELKEFHAENKTEIASCLALIRTEFNIVEEEKEEEIISHLPEECFFTGMVSEEKKVVGTLLVTKSYEPLKLVYKYVIDYVVVDSSYRGQKIATKLIEYVIQKAKVEAISYLELTSNPKREIARHIYQKLGFQAKGTDVFKRNIENNEK